MIISVEAEHTSLLLWIIETECSHTDNIINKNNIQAILRLHFSWDFISLIVTLIKIKLDWSCYQLPMLEQ